jgi:hypothetical protein
MENLHSQLTLGHDHFLAHLFESIITIILPFYTIHSELLTSPLNKSQINKNPILSTYKTAVIDTVKDKTTQITKKKEQVHQKD